MVDALATGNRSSMVVVVVVSDVASGAKEGRCQNTVVHHGDSEDDWGITTFAITSLCARRCRQVSFSLSIQVTNRERSTEVYIQYIPYVVQRLMKRLAVLV